jgi:hypothetical protein
MNSSETGFRTAQWKFNNGRKRDVGAEEECRKPDGLVLADGQQMYDIRDMYDDMLDELLGLARNGTAATEMPEGFKMFESK